MQKRAVLSGRLSFVHAGYPIFKVHFADFFSNIFFLSKAAYAWGRNSCVRFAFFSMSRLPKHFCAHWSQHLPCRCFSLFITPECYSGILVKNTPSFRKGLGVGYICRFLRFLSHLPLLYLPFFRRETSGRRPREQRHNSPPTKSAVC